VILVFQFLVGNDLQSCREALISDVGDSLHLLERINIDLQVQNSIVPGALSLARFKVSGELPTLQVNISDMKYKSLMRLIDVCIPNFNDDADVAAPTPARKSSLEPLQLPPALFGHPEPGYIVEDGNNHEGDESSSRDEQFFEAEDGSAEVGISTYISLLISNITPQRPDLHQHNFEFNFQVHHLKASLSKSNSNGDEKPLGDVSFERFSLMFALAKLDMRVDVNLRYFVFFFFLKF
jgi:vacuolar protein sorting-associated protein 13A/C